MNKFAVRATDIEAARGSMINEGGKVKSIGAHSSIVDTRSGLWTFSFLPSQKVRDALKLLEGATVTCIYQEK